MALLGTTGVVKAEGESPNKPLKTEEKMKFEIFDQLSEIQISDYHLNDETVDVYFKCAADGTVKVERVEGGTCLLSECVKNSLSDRKLFVDKNLQDTSHHISVRYVVK